MPAAVETRRELGQYYTPSPVARQIIAACLDRFWSEHPGEWPRVLDPACGDGAFLIEVFDQLCGRFAATNAVQRLELLRRCVFGVDLNADAIHLLRGRLWSSIAPDKRLRRQTRRVLSSNLHVGCALTGSDLMSGPIETAASSVGQAFQPALQPGLTSREWQAGKPAPHSFTNLTANRESESAIAETESAIAETESAIAERAIHWRAAFPQAVAAGGFDCIVGNPPYRRELHSREAWEQIIRSPLGRRWRQARMDLWHYFLHRGLDLLRPGGWLSFIVNSYWTASRGARPLIERLERETTLEELVLLGKAGVFADVNGRHLIFRLRKGRSEQPCRVVDLNRHGPALPFPANGSAARLVPQATLYSNGQLVTKPPCRLDAIHQGGTLGDEFEVRQGIAENPPWITARLNRQFGNRFPIGAGVFVLNHEEIARLHLSPAERQLLRPYFSTATLGRFDCPAEPTHHLLYLTRETAPSLDHLPRIREHLNRYRAILERRREVRTGRIGWWHLHWPREERLFTEPRILSVQMGRVPQFVWTEQPAFVGFSVNVILSRGKSAIPLPALTAVLNSSLAHEWFRRHAKERGIAVEINGLLLRRFPLPRRDAGIERRLCDLSRQRHHAQERNAAELEAQINRLVDQLYSGP